MLNERPAYVKAEFDRAASLAGLNSFWTKLRNFSHLIDFK